MKGKVHFERNAEAVIDNHGEMALMGIEMGFKTTDGRHGLP